MKLIISNVSGIPIYEPVSYTHLDVYKRQMLARGTERRDLLETVQGYVILKAATFETCLLYTSRCV